MLCNLTWRIPRFLGRRWQLVPQGVKRVSIVQLPAIGNPSAVISLRIRTPAAFASCNVVSSVRVGRNSSPNRAAPPCLRRFEDRNRLYLPNPLNHLSPLNFLTFRLHQPLASLTQQATGSHQR